MCAAPSAIQAAALTFKVARLVTAERTEGLEVGGDFA